MYCICIADDSRSQYETQLQHIQHLLEILPSYRYNLARNLIAYLIKYIEREQISMKNISLICEDSQVCESIFFTVHTFSFLIILTAKLFCQMQIHVFILSHWS